MNMIMIIICMVFGHWCVSGCERIKLLSQKKRKKKELKKWAQAINNQLGCLTFHVSSSSNASIYGLPFPLWFFFSHHIHNHPPASVSPLSLILISTFPNSLSQSPWNCSLLNLILILSNRYCTYCLHIASSGFIS